MNLSSPITTINRLTKDHTSGLLRLSLHTLEDLLYHFPSRYADSRSESHIAELTKGASVTLYGLMEKVTVRRSFKGHVPMTEARVVDTTGNIRVIWFNQAYIGKMYPEGTKVKVNGIVQEDSRGFFLSNPIIEKLTELPEHQDSLFAGNTPPEFLTPVYRETKGVSSLYLYTLIKKIIGGGILDQVIDPIPEYILKRLSLPSLKEALLYIHFPKTEDLTVAARKRFAFEEIFYMQVKQHKEKHEAKHLLAHAISFSKKELMAFIKQFPFTPTEAQNEAITSILTDIQKTTPMGRLLEGDVGSGKTFVAATIAHAVTATKSDNGKPLQVAYMAPTEILARQHFESFITYFKDSHLEIGLLTGSGCKKYPSKTADNATDISKAQLKKWLKEGKMSIVIGTHALIQSTVEFENLALIIIDEQHRFGVKQRAALTRRHSENLETTKIPHLLSMTATPIPRTLALTMFGDLDLTVIDQMPLERKKIITEIVQPSGRDKVYEHIRNELKDGRQVYVICPRIDEQDEEERQKRILKSVKEEAERLANIIFPDYVVDILHSKMKKQEKEEVMQDFLDKKSDILVATSVVEVGVNVPNATVIIIEHADRFGLAQLHQLRGRVGRSHYQSHCFLFTESTGESTARRLEALVKAKNGFELAELDMNERGIGTLFDGKQWGLSDVAMEAIKNPKLVEVARKEARDLIEKDATLSLHPFLKKTLEEKERVHME